MAPVSAALSHTSPVRGDQTGTLTSAKDARLSDEPFILDPMKDGLSVSRRTVCFWLSAPTRPITLPAGSVNNLPRRSEEHTSELKSLMRISYAVFCLKKTK